MAQKKAPWFKFFAADYASSVTVNGLNPIQEYFYDRLIIFSALSTPRGSFPADMGRIRELCRWDSMANAIALLSGKDGFANGKNCHSVFVEQVTPVLKCFRFDEENGLYWNDKVAIQLEAKEDESESKSVAGKRGAEKRWHKNSKPVATAIANASQTIADTDTETDIKPTSTSGEPPLTSFHYAQLIIADLKIPGSRFLLLAVEKAVKIEAAKSDLRTAARDLLVAARLFQSVANKKCKLTTFFEEGMYLDEPITWEKGNVARTEVRRDRRDARVDEDIANQREALGAFGIDLEVAGAGGVDDEHAGSEGTSGTLLAGRVESVPKGVDRVGVQRLPAPRSK